MKQTLLIATILFSTFALNAQQTEDEVYTGKGRVFGNFKPSTTRPINGQINPVSGLRTVTGTVVGACKRDCCNNKRTVCSIDIQTEDSLVSIGTLDYGFTVPKDIVGKRIVVEGAELGRAIRERRPVRKQSQRDVEFTATGVKILD